jgi:hypothetical protein
MAKLKFKELPNFVSPVCEVKWACITHTAPKYENKGDEFKVTMILDPENGEHASFLASLKGYYNEAKEKAGPRSTPNRFWQKEVSDEEETGRLEVVAKSDYAPKFFDARNQPIRQQMKVGNGSKMRIAGKVSVYDISGRYGFKLYFGAAQLIEHVPYEGESGDSFGFEETEGFDAMGALKDAGFTVENKDDDEWPGLIIADDLPEPTLDAIPSGDEIPF